MFISKERLKIGMKKVKHSVVSSKTHLEYKYVEH